MIKNIFSLFGAGILLMFLLAMCQDANNADRRERPAFDSEGFPTGIRYACREFITRQLHDPSKADFDGYTNWPVRRLSNGNYLVTAGFRGANAFGATVISRASCEIQHADQSMRLINITNK